MEFLRKVYETPLGNIIKISDLFQKYYADDLLSINHLKFGLIINVISFILFRQSANDIEMIFAHICAFQKTKVKRCFGRVVYHFTIFGLKSAKTNFF